MLIKPENKEKMKGKRHICKHTGMSLSASNLFIICKKYQLGQKEKHIFTRKTIDLLYKIKYNFVQIVFLNKCRKVIDKC